MINITIRFITIFSCFITLAACRYVKSVFWKLNVLSKISFLIFFTLFTLNYCVAAPPKKLYEFIATLISKKDSRIHIINNDDSSHVRFILKDAKSIASDWAKEKKRNPDKATYANLSRALRYYYMDGLMGKGKKRREYWINLQHKRFSNTQKHTVNIPLDDSTTPARERNNLTDLLRGLFDINPYLNDTNTDSAPISIMQPY